MTEQTQGTRAFRAARDLLLRRREDYEAARSQFSWPQLDEFNWALDWFDVIAAEHPDAGALRVVTEDSDTRLSYAELAVRSNQVANCCAGSASAAATGCCSCWATSRRCGRSSWRR